jgi:hypothetical protein
VISSSGVDAAAKTDEQEDRRCIDCDVDLVVIVDDGDERKGVTNEETGDADDRINNRRWERDFVRDITL